MLERTLNARFPPRSTVFLSLPPHPHRRFINYSSPPRTRCHIPLRHVAPLVYRSSNFDNSPPTCLARTNILRRKLDNFSPTTLVTQHFVIQNSLSLSPSGLIARNSVGFGDHERHCISMYLNIVIPSWSMERKEVRRGLGYLPRDILLVGNAGFSFLEEVPERGSSEMESSIARRTFQSCDTDYQTSPEEGFQCWKREESLALRVEARAEAGGRRRSVSVIHGQWAEYLFGSPFHRVPRSFRFMIDLSTVPFGSKPAAWIETTNGNFSPRIISQQRDV